MSLYIKCFLLHRYLSKGDSLHSIAWGFRMGHSTLCELIKPVCDALWNRLKDEVIPKYDEEFWRYQSKGFEMRCNFPHAIGAVDGKHVNLQAPPNSGTYFHNYKGFFSIVLLAIAGFDYHFTYVNIGGYGSQCDSQLFVDSAFYNLLQKKEFKLPPAEKLPNDEGGEAMPYFFLGDCAFRHTEQVQKGFPGRGGNDREKIYNYRLSSARRCVENAFGILTQRWGIYDRRITLSPEKVDSCVRATVVLHNYLSKTNDAITARVLQDGFDVREELRNARGLAPLQATRQRNPCARAKEVWEYLANYFQNKGSVHWQRQAANLED